MGHAFYYMMNISIDVSMGVLFHAFMDCFDIRFHHFIV